MHGFLFNGRLKWVSETYDVSQVRADVRGAVPLLQSDCTHFTKALAVFHVAKIDTMEKTILRNFTVISSYKTYFVIS